ncbi:MAG TPA: hypothetical protein VKH41_02910 [Myxococcota bacterium]|nr:hypothetical protein [Myxococcota bacterium]
MRSLARLVAFVGSAVALTGCTMFGARIHVARAEGAPFTQREEDAAKAVVDEICRAAGFREGRPKPGDPSSSWPYVDFVSFDGEGSEQDTVGIVGMMRRDRREILISIGDWNRSDPLPATRNLVDDLRSALQRSFPDARIEVTREDKPRLFGP